MKAPLFEDILKICQAIAEASEKSNETARDASYKELIKLCAANENTPKDHPLQWEALADFTNDSDQAIDIYQKGIDCAERLKLTDFIASIYLAMSQRHDEMEEMDKAVEYVNKSHALIADISNEELKTDIEAFLKDLTVRA